MSYKKTRLDSDVLVQPPGSTTVRTAADKFGEVLNVADFGAVGNGATDDTVALQAALDALQEGDTLQFNPGVYRISATLTVSKDSITIKGARGGYTTSSTENKTGTVLAPARGLTNLNFFDLPLRAVTYYSYYSSTTNSYDSGALYVTFEDLAFYSVEGAAATNTGRIITADTPKGLTLRRLAAYATGGLLLETKSGIQDASLTRIEDCLIEGSGNATTSVIVRGDVIIQNSIFRINPNSAISHTCVALSSLSGHSCDISNNEFYSGEAGASQVVPTYFIKFAAAQGDVTRRTLVAHNLFRGGYPPLGTLVELDGITNFNISDNVFDRVGLVLGTWCKGGSVVNNSFETLDAI